MATSQISPELDLTGKALKPPEVLLGGGGGWQVPGLLPEQVPAPPPDPPHGPPGGGPHPPPLPKARATAAGGSPTVSTKPAARAGWPDPCGPAKPLAAPPPPPQESQHCMDPPVGSAPWPPGLQGLGLNWPPKSGWWPHGLGGLLGVCDMCSPSTKLHKAASSARAWDLPDPSVGQRKPWTSRFHDARCSLRLSERHGTRRRAVQCFDHPFTPLARLRKKYFGVVLSGPVAASRRAPRSACYR